MSSAKMIDGKAIAGEVRARVKVAVEEQINAGHRAPVLATVLVGEDPASQVYIRNKHKACEEAGIRSIHHDLDASSTQADVESLVRALNEDPSVDGILVQLPLPEGLDAEPVIGLIDPQKDVDGLTPTNAGLLALGRPRLVPCTPSGVMEILRHEGVELRGINAVVIGRSDLVGRPLAALLLGEDATVTVAHSKTRDLAGVCRDADLVIAAVGRPGLVNPEMIRPGAAVIDVGINRTDHGLVGDVDPSVSEVAGVMTPVPGGVGPMTIAMLLENTLSASRNGNEGA